MFRFASFSLNKKRRRIETRAMLPPNVCAGLHSAAAAAATGGRYSHHEKDKSHVSSLAAPLFFRRSRENGILIFFFFFYIPLVYKLCRPLRDRRIKHPQASLQAFTHDLPVLAIFKASVVPNRLDARKLTKVTTKTEFCFCTLI